MDELPDEIRPIAEAHTAGQPVTTGDIAALPTEAREWYLRNCWNCRKPRADCECLFP
jgi:hypothetical protein